MRSILLAIQRDPKSMHRIGDDDGLAFDDVIHEHCIYAEEKGLVAGSLWKNGGAFRLTSHGQDYLDAISDPSIWEQTKSVVAEQGGSVTLELVKAVASAFLKKQIEERTGLTL